jgi:hypothetical protein
MNDREGVERREARHAHTSGSPDEPSRNPPSDAQAEWLELARNLALVGALELALVAFCAETACSQDEAIIWRWIRTCADHPVRTGIALWLAAVALRCSGPRRTVIDGRGEQPPW